MDTNDNVLTSHDRPTLNSEVLHEVLEQYIHTEIDVLSLPNNDRRRNAHAIFQYPAMMVPAVQETLLNILLKAEPHIKNVFDPFVGAGTTLTAAMLEGLDCYGQDINPLAILVSQVKAGPFFYTSLSERVGQVIQHARSDPSSEIEVSFENIFKWFQRDVAIQLAKLKRAIEADNQKWSRKFMWVVLAETVRLTSNDRTSTYKLHVRPQKEVQERVLSPLNLFESIAKANLEDLKTFKERLDKEGRLQSGRYTGEITVRLGDTAKVVNIPRENFDLIVTSPPYGDNLTTITYGQHSYLPLHWINLSDIDPLLDKSILRSTQEIDRRSLGGYRSRELSQQIEFLCEKSVQLSQVFKLLKDEPRERSSRVAAFFCDFNLALDRIVLSLKNGGYMVWIMGNRHVGGLEIPNDLILCDLLSKKGVSFVTDLERTIHGKRMPLRNSISKLMNKEKILILRKYEGQ